MLIDLHETQNMLEWLKTKLYLNTQTSNARNRSVQRGQVYWCNFGCGVGSEMQKKRPAVIIQNNIANIKSGNTIVIPITHDNSTLPCMAPITPQYDNTGILILDGQANTSNLICVSKARLGDPICTLPNSDMKKIDEALAKSVDLMGYYADLKSKLDDKLNYIEIIKQQRNEAQDKIAEVVALLDTDENDEQTIEKIKKIIDND